MHDQFDELQKMLRSRRDQLPPAGYFEEFLVEFHRRQQVELIRRPLWKIAVDRLESLLPPLQVPGWAYASSFAVTLTVTGLLARQLLVAGSAPALPAAPGGERLAAGPAPAVAAATETIRPLSAARPTFRTSVAVADPLMASAAVLGPAPSVSLPVVTPNARLAAAADPAWWNHPPAVRLVEPELMERGTGYRFVPASARVAPAGNPVAAARRGADSGHRLRYVLDSQPVRYERRPSSF